MNSISMTCRSNNHRIGQPCTLVWFAMVGCWGLLGDLRGQDSSLLHNPLMPSGRLVQAQAPQASPVDPRGNFNAREAPAGPTQNASNNLVATTQQFAPSASGYGSPPWVGPDSLYAGSVAPLAGLPSAAMPGVYPNNSYGLPPLSLYNNSSYVFQPAPPPRVLRVHDIVQIRVDEMARSTAEGIANQRKNGLYDATLLDWVKLDGLSSLKLASQAQGDPKVAGSTNQVIRANSQILTRQALTFSIAAEIADIYPNGNIVLHARKSISDNDNRWEISLSGICQDSAIGPDNVVLSRDIIDLKIDKQESGQARDGYKRGWFSEWLGRFQPF